MRASTEQQAHRKSGQRHNQGGVGAEQASSVLADLRAKFGRGVGSQLWGEERARTGPRRGEEAVIDCPVELCAAGQRPLLGGNSTPRERRAWFPS